MSAIQYYRTTINQETNAFVTVWNTENVGYSASNQIMLPLSTSGVYDFIVNWGDGIKERITSFSDPAKTHTYSVPGIYTVRISGVFQGLVFAASQTGGEGPKLLEVKRWGCFQNLGEPTFYGCNNMDVTATDVPDFSLTTNLSGFFRGCVNLVGNDSFSLWEVGHIQLFGTGNNGLFRNASLFNQSIFGWDFGSATAFNECFYGALAFNQNIGHINMSGVTLANQMLRDTGMSVENYSNTLVGWAEQTLQQGVVFRADPCKYNPSGAAARQHIIDTYNWVITDGGPA